MLSLEDKTGHSCKTKDQGFTMVEIAIVVLIFGIITIPLLEMYSRYLSTQRRELTVTRVEDSINQLKIYRMNKSAAPCPADRTLSINDANYGIEDCAAAAALPASGGCTAGNGICRVPGARTPWASSTPAVLGRDTVLIGAYPFRTIASANGGLLGADAGLDGWRNKLTYAVTDSATNVFGLHTSEDMGKDFKYGVVKAVDEFGNDTAGIKDDGLFVVVSHGETGAGAYTPNGALLRACDTSTRDGENCNNDSTFTRSIGNYDGNTPDFYDDYAYFFKDQSGELWGYMYNPATASSSGHIRNLNGKNVGINTGATTPTSLMTVNGGIRAETTLTNSICNSSGTNCIPTSFFWDYLPNNYIAAAPQAGKNWRNTCPAGQIVKAILNGEAQCEAYMPIPLPPGGAGASCPTNEYITSILSNGCIVCTNGVTYPSAGQCS